MSAVRHRLVRLSPMSSVLLWCTTAVGIVAFTWPFFIQPHSGLSFAHGQGATWVFAALLPLLLLLGVAELRDGTLDVKTVALLAILAAVGAVLRIVGSGSPGGEPLFALIIISGRSMGRGSWLRRSPPGSSDRGCLSRWWPAPGWAPEQDASLPFGGEVSVSCWPPTAPCRPSRMAR